MIRLLIKTHKKTGLKYLCKTEREDWETYLGSGKYWKKHLRKHGNDITTQLLFETEDKTLFKQVSKEKSIEYDVVNSKLWANLVNEEGDGGNTVGKKKWITNGIDERYYSGDLPEGWYYGRSNNCKFKDSNFQKELNKRVDPITRGKAIKNAWDSGNFKRDHSKCATKGDNNPSKRPEVKEKIRNAALLDSKNRSKRMKENRVWEKSKNNDKNKKCK